MTDSHILTAEELADRRYPSAIAISGDGRFVAFVIEPMGRSEEHAISEIWLSRDGQPAQQFSSGLAGASAPVFSPDSAKLAFLSDRHEPKTQRVYLLPLDGGEATRISSIEGTLTSLSWSPDGAHLGVLVTDPETEAEKKQKEERNDPILENQNLKYSRLFVIDVASGASRQLTFGDRTVLDYAWSRDGQTLAVATSHRTDVEGEFQDVDVSLVAVSGGRLRTVATLRGVASPLIFVDHPDGEQIAMRHNGFFDDPVDSAWLMSTATGERRELLTDDHGNVDWIGAISGKPGQIAMRMVDGVHAHAYVIDVASGERTKTLPAGWQDRGTLHGGPVYSADGKTLAFVWSDSVTPEEVFVAKAGKEPVKLTSFGESFAGRLNRSELVEWQSDEWTIQGHLVYPHGYEEGTRYPLLIEAHGGPSWQWEDHCFLDWHDWAQFMASRGFAVLAPNPRGSTGRGAAFQKALQNDVGGGEVRDLITGAQAMIDRGIADPDRLGIGGWSWGGYLTATTITRTNVFKAAMMGAGLSNLFSDHGTDDIPSANLLYFPGEPYHHADMYWAGSALKCVANCTTPTLIIHGDADARVHPLQGKEMYTALSRLGIDTEFVRYPRQGHTIKERNYQIDLLNRLAAWFEKYLMA
jgi:dipeptidyl aminopeptidase/acylaminoacyl peptidase